MAISYDENELERAFTALFDSIDYTPVYKEIGDILVTSIDDNFEAEGRFGPMEGGEYTGGSQKWEPSQRAQGLVGSKWKKNKRRKRGPNKGLFGKGKTLQDSGGLVGSIDYLASADGVVVSSSKEYAPYVHYGSLDGKTPARPFLVIQEEDFAEIELAVAAFLARVI